MSIQISEVGKVCHIAVLNQKFDREVGAEIEVLVRQPSTENFEIFELDLTTAEYIDSAGIGKLLFLRKVLLESNKELIIPKISIRLYDFFAVLNILSVIPITPPTPSRIPTKPRFE